MTEAQYPTTVGELLASPYSAGGRDDFFLTARVEIGERASLFQRGPVRLIVDENDPVLVNKDSLRDKIFAETGRKLATRMEFANKKIPADVEKPAIEWSKLYTMASGVALWVASDRVEPHVYLLQNSPDKKFNPGRFNFASGLVTGSLAEAAFAEPNQEIGMFFPKMLETGLLIPQHSGRLMGVNIDFPAEMLDLSAAFKKSIWDARAEQEPFIRDQLQKLKPAHVSDAIDWVTHMTEDAGHGVDKVSVSLLGKEFNFRAHCFVDNIANSANVHFTTALRLPGGMSPHQAIVVDPESFDGKTAAGRFHGLFTLGEATMLDTIPAPSDYFKYLAGLELHKVRGVAPRVVHGAAVKSKQPLIS